MTHLNPVSNEHFKCANEKRHVLMSDSSMLMHGNNSLVMHGFLPGKKLSGKKINLVIKNKSGDLSDNNNHRPIALATVASKPFESLLFSRTTPFLCQSI